jgi:hypothetical protein
MAVSLSKRPALAFFRFHLSAGIRTAIRTLAPLVALIFALYYIFRIEFFVLLAQALFIESGNLVSALFFSAVSLGTAAIAAPRICLGLTGWIRHLPLNSQTNRRLAGLAIFAALIPVLVFLAIPQIILLKNLEMPLTIHVLGLPFLGLASALCVLPVQRKRLARPLAVAACLLSIWGKWPLLLAGALAIVVCDLVSGPLLPVRKRPHFHRGLKGYLFYATISWRALKLRFLASYIFALLVIGASALFISNNSLNPYLSTKAVLFGGALSLAIVCAGTGSILASRRPPWPWARSLPWSAGQRIVMDSLFLGVQAIPLLILVAIMNPAASAPLALSLPLLTLYTSLVIRRSSEYRMGVSGKIFMLGLPGSLLITLLPFISFLYLASAPLALKYAVKEERCQKVSRWLEMHHLAAGDSLSWSKQ